jgi:hypothetical protein
MFCDEEEEWVQYAENTSYFAMLNIMDSIPKTRLSFNLWRSIDHNRVSPIPEVLRIECKRNPTELGGIPSDSGITYYSIQAYSFTSPITDSILIRISGNWDETQLHSHAMLCVRVIAQWIHYNSRLPNWISSPVNLTLDHVVKRWWTVLFSCTIHNLRERRKRNDCMF